MRRVAQTVNASLDLVEVLRLVLEAMRDAFDFQHSMILLPVDGKFLEVRASLGYEGAGVGTQVDMDAGPLGVVARRKKLVRLASTGVSMRYAQALSPSAKAVLPGLKNLESMIVVPMLVDDELAGIVSIESPRVLAFEPEDEQLVMTVANLAAASIRNARLFEELGETNRSAQRFVPREFVRFLDRAHLKDLERGQSVNRAMTVLFSDLRGFTSVVENLDPEATFKLLNGYLAAMVPPIEAHSGFVDKFIGDAIMALFDDVTADAALKSAIEQHRALEALNASRGGIALAMGIGLHTGPLTLGVVGSEERLSATVYGDSVNLASRVEGLTRMYGARILITDSTVTALSDRDRFALRFVDRVRVKGKDQPVELWECLDALTDEERAARADAEAMHAARQEYDAGNFAVAQRLLREICARSPQDPLPAAWLVRSTELITRPPDHWDGAVRLDKK